MISFVRRTNICTEARFWPNCTNNGATTVFDVCFLMVRSNFITKVGTLKRKSPIKGHKGPKSNFSLYFMLTFVSSDGTICKSQGPPWPRMEQQMAVVVNEKQSNFELPEEGSYLAVVADVIDLGEVATNFGVKPRVQIVWLLDAYSEETGEQLRLSAFYNASLDPKANLRKDIRSIIGKDVEGTYDLEELLGANSQLVIQHNSTDKKTYANIVAILKAPKGKFLEIPADFERKIDKDGVGSTENPVNSPGSAKAAQQKKSQQKKSQPQLKKAAPAPVQSAQSAQPPARPVRRAAPPAVAPEPEPEYEETPEVDEVQEAAPAPQPAPAPRRQARTLPPTQPVRQAAAPAAPAAPVIRRARVTAPAPVEPEQDAPITDEDIPF